MQTNYSIFYDEENFNINNVGTFDIDEILENFDPPNSSN